MKRTYLSKIQQQQIEQAKAIIQERNAEIQELIQEYTRQGNELAAQLEVLKQKIAVHRNESDATGTDTIP